MFELWLIRERHPQWKQYYVYQTAGYSAKKNWRAVMKVLDDKRASAMFPVLAWRIVRNGVTLAQSKNAPAGAGQ